MSRKLTQLPDLSFTSLDWESILNDTRALILNHPEYIDTWDDFLSSNAGMMLLELFAFVTEKYCSRVDWIAKQLFISTATDRQAVINILKLINHRPALPMASKINISMKLTKWIEPFLMSRDVIYAPNLNGTITSFQLLDLNEVDGKPDYNYQYAIDTGTSDVQQLEFSNIPFYEGQTITEQDIYMEGLDNEYIDLQTSPVIENTVRVYSISRGNTELPEVESYISPEAQQNGVQESEKLPPWTIEINSNNQVRVKFGSSSLVKIANKGERLMIVYRSGGGAINNVTANSVTTTKTYTDTVGARATAIFTNPSPGFGGTDAENLDDAKLVAPISLRSANKTVTAEDYISHLELSPLVMKANVIGKENETAELAADVGYPLPPLDTWIYITPARDNWELYDPASYNKLFKVIRPYVMHGEIDHEDIYITQINQSAYLKKYRKYKGYTLYITLHESTTENVDWLFRDSYVLTTDYTLESSSGMLTRVSTADGGNIPPNDRTLRVRYVYDATPAAHKAATAFTISANQTILLDNTGANKIFPGSPVKTYSYDGKILYEDIIDYNIDYVANTLKLTQSSKISIGDRVIVYCANNWMSGQDDSSEEKMILDTIVNKKMICVDNHVKDTVFSTFDISATIYCSKNLIKTISTTLENYIRGIFNLSSAQYTKNVTKSDIINNIMKVSGVINVEVSYLGRNYEAFRRYLLNNLSRDELIAQSADTVEYKIACKYNEILVLSNDEYEGYQTVENKRHGCVFTFAEFS